MTGYSWIAPSLLSAFFVSARYLYIKKFCRAVPAEILVFATRSYGAILLLPCLYYTSITLSNPSQFFSFMTMTVVVTAVAMIMQIRIVQTKELSSSLPFLNFMPVFMVPFACLVLKEAPSPWALWGIVLTSIGAYAINYSNDKQALRSIAHIFSNKTTRHMLIVAVLLALSTVLDKPAIAVSNAYTYSFLWTVASALLGGCICLRHPIRDIIRYSLSKHIIIQTVFWVAGFYLQMFAVQKALAITSGVTYVKMLTLLNILITVTVAGSLFKECHRLRRWIASVMMLAGSMLVVWKG